MLCNTQGQNFYIGICLKAALFHFRKVGLYVIINHLSKKGNAYGKRRILIVDDEEELAGIIAEMLTGCGYITETASGAGGGL